MIRNICFILVMMCMLPIIGECATYQVDTVAEFNALSLSSGDIVEFNSNSPEFRFASTTNRDSRGIGLRCVSGVTYRSFGGKKATITSSLNQNEAGDWSDEGGNIWSTTDGAFDIDVGSIVFNESSFGKKAQYLVDVDSDLEFFSDWTSSDTVYVYSTVNPATRFNDVEVCCGNQIVYFTQMSDVTIENLTVKFGSAHGLYGETSENITIRNCDIMYIGGRYQSGSTRYGNGIEFWYGAVNNHVYNNYFYQCYDEAYTNQGLGGTVNGVYVHNNVAVKTHLGFTCWLQNGSMQNVYITNNTCIDGGGEWSYAERFPRAQLFGLGSTSGSTVGVVEFKNNIGQGSTEDVLYVFSGFDTTNLVLDNNCWYNPDGNLVDWRGTDYSDMSSYQAASSQDTNSIAVNPKLTETNRISQSSPCRYAGTNNSDIGAYPYYPGFFTTRGTDTIGMTGTPSPGNDVTIGAD